MPGLVDILNAGAEAARRMADGVREARVEAQTLSRVRAPSGSRPAAVPGAGPGEPSPLPPGSILGANGQVILSTGRVARSGAAGRATGSSAGGGTGGGSGPGSGRTADVILLNMEGRNPLPLATIEIQCTRTTVPILNSLGGVEKEIPAWDCGGFGTYLDPGESGGVLNEVSARSEGGKVGSSRAPRRERPDIPVSSVGKGGGISRRPGAGYTNTNLSGQSTSLGVTDSGPTSITGDVRAPGVEAEVRRTNQLLERNLRDDGGAALRSLGGL